MKWIDENGTARADKEDCEGGYVPIICFVCGGDGRHCDDCDETGVILVRLEGRLWIDKGGTIRATNTGYC